MVNELYINVFKGETKQNKNRHVSTAFSTKMMMTTSRTCSLDILIFVTPS